MNKQVRFKVLNFMKNIKTEDMNTNEFIIEFFKYQNWSLSIYDLKKWISFESITRSRRYWLNNWFTRSEQSRDNEEIYKKEFQRTPLGIF